MPYTFVFPTDLLHDRAFYVSWAHMAGDISRAVYFKKNTPIPNIHRVLDLVERNSIHTAKWMQLHTEHRFVYPTFGYFQEIFFKKKVSIDDATHFIIPKEMPPEHIAYIKTHYPKLQLVVSANMDIDWRDDAKYVHFLNKNIPKAYNMEKIFYTYQLISRIGKSNIV